GGGSTYNETTGTVSAPSYTMSNADGSTTTVNNVGDALGSINSQGIKYFHANSTGADSRALGKDSVAIGPNAVANNAGDVALGSGSSTAAVTPVAGDMIGSTEYSYAGTTPDNAVSVGSVGHERQVQNVAAGQVTATSTDAVNGSQLYATDSAIDTLSQTTSIADKGNVKYDKNVDGTPNYSSVTLAGPASTDGGRTGGTTIGNVHQGDLSSTSTDAVNGSQLYATNQQVGQNTTDITNLQSTTTELGDSTASNLGGGSTYDPATGAVSAPSYTMSNADGSTTTVNNVGDALGSINSQGIKYFHASSTAPDSQALGTDSVAIGPNAVASFTGDVALGAGSVTAAAVGTASETLSGVTYAFAGGTPTSTVSVGSAGQERTVTNVAAGRVSGTSTDAVNGSQLYATNQAVSSLGNQVTNIGNGSGGMFQVSQDHNTPAPAATGNDSAAGGAGAVASGDASLAVGNGSTASGNQGTALGNGAMASGTGSTAVGQGAVASADGSVALGNGSSDGGRGAEQYTGKYSGAQNNTAGTVSVGNAATGETRTISNVADGKEATDAVNLRQLDGAVQAANTYTDTQISKVDSTVTGIRNGSAGMFQVSQDANGTVPQATGMKSVAGGNNAEASGSQSTAVGDDAHATASNSVALGQGSVADRANSVSVGSAGNERQVTNVAAGTAGTDAVNVSQLNAAQAGSVQYGRNADGSVDYGNVTLNSGGSPAAIHNVEAGTAATDAVNVGQLNDGLNKTMNWSKSYTDERFQTLNSNLNTIGNRANAGIAAAIAMASLPQAYQPDQSAASVALGNFHGETGIAVGVSKISESGRYVFKLNASDNTRGDAGVGVGAGVVW
ncbi:MAG TPA: YadA-like family protein, partial [Rhodanobacter sp.]|nr:YadA-like family protein [Rhodanobacter sp.]